MHLNPDLDEEVTARETLCRNLKEYDSVHTLIQDRHRYKLVLRLYRRRNLTVNTPRVMSGIIVANAIAAVVSPLSAE